MEQDETKVWDGSKLVVVFVSLVILVTIGMLALRFGSGGDGHADHQGAQGDAKVESDPGPAEPGGERP